MILDDLFTGTDVKYTILDRKIILAPDFLTKETDATLVLQQNKITGTITGTDNKPLTGVSVIVKGTTTGTLTDINGKFSLTISSDAKSLLFTFVGMESKEVEIGSNTVFNITLSESLVGLDEVVVVGYGTQSRTRLTTSISKLDTKVLANAAMSNPGSALQGTISGLRVINTTGQPGSLPSILLRGGASITSPGSPLVVIDGLVRAMNDVNPSDIESIQVLKDAASTAIYGARANNGVILITTKKGKNRYI